MPEHSAWAAMVWPIPQTSSFSPSTVSRAGAPDGAGLDRHAPPGQLALGQQLALEDPVDRLQVELGRHVEHGEVLVVEVLDPLGLLVVAPDQVVVEGDVLLDVAPEVHGHEPGHLEEAGVDPAGGTPVAERDGGDHVAARTS